MNSSSEFSAHVEEMMPMIQETLASGHCIRNFTFRGVSMLPMLRQGKDSVELAPLPEKLHKYDLPLYRYPNGKYVMHRIVGVKEDHYLCLGDNTYRYEHIKPEQMIAVVSAFKRGDKRIEVTNYWYRLYSRVWYWCYPARKLLRMGKNWLRRRFK